jgi:hypothetical protein
MKNLYKYFIVFIFLLSSQVLADTTLINTDERLSDLFENQDFHGESSLLGGKFVSPLDGSIKVHQETGELQYEFTSTYMIYSGTFSENLQLKKSTFMVKGDEIIKVLNHDKRVTIQDETKKNMIIKYYLKGQEKGTKKVAYDQNTIDSDVFPLFLQGMLLKKATNFKTDAIIKAKGMRLTGVFTLESGSFNDFKQKYDPPEKIKALSLQDDNVLVYIMEWTGLIHIVFPYRFYYVFSANPPHQIIAYWGGAPKDIEYQIYIK